MRVARFRLGKGVRERKGVRYMGGKDILGKGEQAM